MESTLKKTCTFMGIYPLKQLILQKKGSKHKKVLMLFLKVFPFNQTGSEVIKNFCSTQLSMKFFLLINVKMPTVVGILTVNSRKNSIICLSEPEKS